MKDVYPESLLGKLPFLSRAIAAPPLIALDRWIARGTQRVIVISENMRQKYLIGRGLSSEKVIKVLDWVDETRFEELPSRSAACKRYNVPENLFTFFYLGNIGPVAGVEFLIEAFSSAGLNDAQLVIAGDGSSKQKCVDLARQLKATNIQFISDPAAENVPLLQSLARVCLLPVRRGGALSSIPSKLMAYLFSGKPVIATVDAESDTAKTILEATCGWIGEPENTVWLAQKLAEVASMAPVALDRMGQCGRDYGLNHFSKSKGVRRLSEVVLSARRQTAL